MSVHVSFTISFIYLSCSGLLVAVVVLAVIVVVVVVFTATLSFDGLLAFDDDVAVVARVVGLREKDR